MVSDWKLTVNPIEDPLYVMNHLLAAFKILSLSLSFSCLIVMYLSVDLFELILF